MQKEIIGKKELISLVDLKLFELVAKIDTGAYTSSLHCEDIVVKDDNFVYFTPLDASHEGYKKQRVKFPLFSQKIVKSSNGMKELRAYIQTKAIFFGKEYVILLSLTDRSDMRHPILIGRKFLKKRFLVDVSSEFLGKKEKKWEFIFYQEMPLCIQRRG